MVKQTRILFLKIETESHKDAAKADDSPSATPDHSTTRLRDDEPMDASEQRRLWAMAATSAAHLITEFADRPIPDFSAVRKTFTPASNMIDNNY